MVVVGVGDRGVEGGDDFVGERAVEMEVELDLGELGHVGFYRGDFVGETDRDGAATSS